MSEAPVPALWCNDVKGPTVDLARKVRVEQTKGLMNLVEFGRVCTGRVVPLDDRDRFHCAMEINGKGVAKQVLCLTDIVNKVCNHARCFDKGETKNEINSDVWACSNEKRGCIAVLG